MQMKNKIGGWRGGGKRDSTPNTVVWWRIDPGGERILSDEGLQAVRSRSADKDA